MKRLGAKLPELFALALGLALSSDALLGVPGPESALLLGALVSPVLAATLAARSVDAEGRTLLARALLRATTTALAAFLPLMPRALFGNFCGGEEAFLFLFFGPLFGFVAAALLGVSARLLFDRRALAISAALALTLGSIAFGVHEFWSGPSVVLFGEFGGYFPGTFYDPGARLQATLLTYRLGSLFLILGLALFVGSAESRTSLAPRLLALVMLGVFGLFRLHGDALGHRVSAADIDRALGAEVEGERCTLHVPRELAPETRALHLADCEREVVRLAALLGVSPPARVHVYFYRSAQEKRGLMGTGDVDLAKPWRREAHLVLAPWPHPVLPHELVHVVGAEVTGGLFGVPGRLFGLVPNAGLIEGLAVALSWEERLGLDPHQASRALLELGRLPPAADVTGLAFIRHPASAAYAAAGSFLRFILEEHGPGKLAEIYRTGSLDPLGEPLGALEARYHERLRALPLPEGALELAATRFSRPSVFHARCPHEAADLRTRLAQDLAAGDATAALESTEALLAIDDADLGAHVERVRALALLRRHSDALEAHALLVSRGFPEPLLARSLTHLGDARWLAGDEAEALTLFARALPLPQTEDAARNIEARLYALAHGGEVALLLRELLLGRDGRGSDAVLASHLAAALGEHGEASLGAYLAARQLASRDHHEAALALLERAHARELPSSRFVREAARMRLRALTALGRQDEARVLAEELAREPATAREAAAYLERLAP